MAIDPICGCEVTAEHVRSDIQKLRRWQQRCNKNTADERVFRLAVAQRIWRLRAMVRQANAG